MSERIYKNLLVRWRFEQQNRVLYFPITTEQIRVCLIIDNINIHNATPEMVELCNPIEMNRVKKSLLVISIDNWNYAKYIASPKHKSYIHKKGWSEERNSRLLNKLVDNANIIKADSKLINQYKRMKADKRLR